MTPDDILNRLRHLWSMSERALELLEQDAITPQASQELRELVPRLKREIRAEYKRTSLITVQEKMSPDELAYYLPAIHGAYTDTGLDTLRTEAKPKREWHASIKAVNAKLKHYVRQVESGKRDVTEQELNNRLPIIPHAVVAETDCPGCLVVGVKDATCQVLCNECGGLIASISAAEVERFFQNLYEST